MRVQTVNLRHRKADRLICTCRVSQQTPPSISWLGRLSRFYRCKNVTHALALGLIGCYQPLALGKIIGREEKGRRREPRRGDTASGHPSSFQILSFFLSLCFPKQSHSQLPPLPPLSSSCHLSVADTLSSLFHSAAPARLPVWPAGSLTPAGAAPPSQMCGVSPEQTERKRRRKRHLVICGRGKDANAVPSRFCRVSSCERNMFWRQPYTGIIQQSTLWPYAASYVLSGVTDAAENHLEPRRLRCRYLLKMPTRTQNSAQNTPGCSALVVRKKGKDERDGFLQLPGDKAAMLLIWDQALRENLHFYHKCFLVFPPHKLRPITTVSWMLLSLPSAYWAHRVDPGSRWSEGRLGYSKGLGFGFPLKQLGCRSHFRPTQSLASSPVTDRMTLSHLRGKWGRSHLEQKCNHKPFVDTGNAPRMKGDHCDGDEILLTREEAQGAVFP